MCDWLKSNESVYSETNNLEQMKKIIKHNQLQTIQNIQETSTSSSNSYYDYGEQTFQSDPFSKLKMTI